MLSDVVVRARTDVFCKSRPGSVEAPAGHARAHDQLVDEARGRAGRGTLPPLLMPESTAVASRGLVVATPLCSMMRTSTDVAG
jgi:hypothetical protein